jgi:hypothetical protein
LFTRNHQPKGICTNSSNGRLFPSWQSKLLSLSGCKAHFVGNRELYRLLHISQRPLLAVLSFRTCIVKEQKAVQRNATQWNYGLWPLVPSTLSFHPSPPTTGCTCNSQSPVCQLPVRYKVIKERRRPVLPLNATVPLVTIAPTTMLCYAAFTNIN